MKKLTKKDIIFSSILVLFFIVLVIILTKGEYLYGSTLDFEEQHYLFPHYLRELFYSDHTLFPDFMFNLGSGQNIFYIAYYGLYSPVIFLSFLFPFIEMITYIQIIMCLTVISSVLLLYFFLRKKGHNELVSFITSFIFLCATPLTLHSHRHIMFMNYMPFLILGFYGVDKFIEKKKSFLLIISLTLMLFTSYMFAVGGFIVLFIYMIYSSSKTNNIKELIISKLKLSIPFIISVLISCIFILPIIYTLLSGRLESNVSVSIADLLTPANNILYDSYSLGLTLISALLLLFVIIKGKKNDRLLGIILSLIIIFPIFNYILNGFMYINAKSLIPFLPLIMILIAKSLSIILKGKLKFYHYILLTYIIISTAVVCYTANLDDDLISKKHFEEILNNNNEYFEIISKYDNSFYRINNQLNGTENLNYINDASEYSTSLYSSTFNNTYKNFSDNVLYNDIPFRNKFITASSNNIISQIILSEKYIVTENELTLGYTLVNEYNGINIYENINVLPLGYSIKDDEVLPFLDEDNYVKEEINYEVINSLNVEVINEDNIIINSKDDGNIKLLLDEKYKDKIIFISFDIKPNNSDQVITINNISNKLTDKGWKYYNENETFNYTFTGTNELNIEINEGTYEITNVTLHSLDYEYLSLEGITNFRVDNISGDIITGKITTNEDEKFILNIPYDEGFIIQVNEEEVKYYKELNGLISFDIKSGINNIVIEFKAPLKGTGTIISLIGLGSMLLYLYIERRRSNK